MVSGRFVRRLHSSFYCAGWIDNGSWELGFVGSVHRNKRCESNAFSEVDMKKLVLVAASVAALGMGGAGAGYAVVYNPGSSSLDWKAHDRTHGRAAESETND